MENYGQIHNEMIGGIMKNVRLSAEMTADQKRDRSSGLCGYLWKGQCGSFLLRA
jgi:hypothetical protein